MKKIIAIILALTTMTMLFAACSKKDTVEEPAYDVNEILQTIETASPVRMSTPIDDEYLSFVGLDSSLYVNYAGSYCPITPGVDIILVVQAQSGKASEVADILEARREAIYKANENYIGADKDKAEAGRVVTKGDYVILAIGGDENVVNNEGVEKAYEVIDEAIENAFK